MREEGKGESCPFVKIFGILPVGRLLHDKRV